MKNARRSRGAVGDMRAAPACSTALVLWLSRLSVPGFWTLGVVAMGCTDG